MRGGVRAQEYLRGVFGGAPEKFRRREPPVGLPFGPEHSPARQARCAADLAGAIVSLGGPESLQKAFSLGALLREHRGLRPG